MDRVGRLSPFLFLGLVALLGAAVLAIFFVARSEDVPSAERLAAPDVRIEAEVEPIADPSLLDPSPFHPDRFHIVFAGHPADLCAEIAQSGVPMSDWSADPLRQGSWQCSSELVPLGSADGRGRQSSLFVSLRGTVEEQLDFLRIKLNGDNPQTVPLAKVTLGHILRSTAVRYGWDWPDELYRAIDQGRAIELMQRGVRLSVHRENPGLTNEADPVLRLNVVMDFPESRLRNTGRGFEPFSWQKPIDR
ncbi:hypothetical protein H2509_07155 [Stappia sp. F7233]|uniref:Uncharacterized protein n=1 Tax=Stappia albiluteola TaxID=2758565 RepID=A0A839ACN6_9HYPH|nr:DUF6030 family protein [Stappia albiluteola]MBA5776906.1 hypothetical protein [Stappia albiluteola]